MTILSQFVLYHGQLWMHSWVFEVGAPEVCVHLLMEFYQLSKYEGIIHCVTYRLTVLVYGQESPEIASHNISHIYAV